MKISSFYNQNGILKFTSISKLKFQYHFILLLFLSPFFVAAQVTIYESGYGISGQNHSHTITTAGDYYLKVSGADGGNAKNNGGARGGSGATIYAKYNFQAGDELTIVAGHAGDPGKLVSGNTTGGGGGGGSAVILNRNGTKTLLVAAGGGGGGGWSALGMKGNSADGDPTIQGNGGGFNIDGGNGNRGGKMGTLDGGGNGGDGPSSNGGFGFGGGGGGYDSSAGGGGGGGYQGGPGRQGGYSFADAGLTNVVRVDGEEGKGDKQKGLVAISTCILSPGYTWTGCEDNDFSNEKNWADLDVPPPSANIIIPDVTNDPILKSSDWVRSVLIQDGGRLTINVNKTLTVSGDVQGITNNGTVINNGTIEIRDPDENALINEGANASFTNNGELKIGSTNYTIGTYGVNNNAPFYNHGTIEIKNTDDDGFYNEGNGSFTNELNGEIYLREKLNNSGSITNKGYFVVDHDANHQSTNFTNTGIINYLQDPIIPNLTNNGFTNKKSTASNCTANMSPSLDLSGSSNLTIDGIYLNETATTGAGTYVQATNTFNPNIVLETASENIFYVKITDAMSDSRVLKWVVEVDDDTNPDFSFCPDNISKNTATNNCTVIATWTTPTATDDCDNSPTVTQTMGAASGSAFPVGSTTIKYTATDEASNEAECSFTITVADNEDPEISGCPNNISKDTDAGVCTAIVSWTAPTATDNCTSPQAIVQTMGNASGSAFPIGTTTIKYTATDDANNEADECSFTITVSENQDPAISGCPTNISKDNDTDKCTAVVSWTAPTATDNCTSPQAIVQTMGNASGSAFPIGTTTIKYTATDDANNEADECSFTITVSDNQDPAISGCPTNISKNNDTDKCTAVVSWTAPTATDNCTSPQAIVQTMGNASGSAFPIGTTTIKYTATDDANNKADECSFTITVSDNQDPAISGCPTNISKDNDTDKCTAVVSWTAPTATDNCTSPQSISQTMGAASGTAFAVGTTTIKYTATDAADNEAECSFTVTVTDGEDPDISDCPTNIVKDNDLGKCSAVATWTSPTATDNCTSPQAVVRTMGAASGTAFAVGTTTIKYTATDDADNEVECSFTITVNEAEDPVINGCPDNISKNNDADKCSAVVSWTAPTATDNCTSPQAVVRTMGAASGTAFAVGTTAIKYTATDAADNEAECSFTITITDNEDPAITGCPNNIVKDNDTGLCSAVATWTVPTATDNCTFPQTISQTMGSASGSAFPVGTTTIKYTAIDDADNEADECSFTITVSDKEDPVISGCPTNISKNNDADKCTAVVSWAAPTATDNCTSPQAVVQTMGAASGTAFAVGTTTIKYTATDAADNEAECSFIITVSDNEVPLISDCPTNISKNNDADKCTAIVSWTAPTATDNCTSPQAVVRTMGAASETAFAVGTTTIKYTATDAADNEAECSFTITVTDSEDPEISDCPSNISMDTDEGECSAVVTWTPPTAADNCTSPQTIVQTMGDESSSAFPVGTTTIKYTATDDADNVSDECSFTITVTDNEDPNPVCKNIEVQLDEEGNAAIEAADIDGGSNDACGIASVTIPPTSFDCDDLEMTHEVVLTVTDIYDNTDQCTATITVLDDINPCCPETHVLFVDHSTPNDRNGDDWNNAVATLEQAFELVAKCEHVTEIWVADGTYYPTAGTDRTVSFEMVKGVAIYGGFNRTETELSERDPVLYPTILSGDIGTQGDASDNSYHVFYHHGGVDETAILDGFIIKNGNADYVGDHEKGAGMFNENASPTVRNCVFENNSAVRGGAIFNDESAAKFKDCSFESNNAEIGGAVTNSTNSTTMFSRCTFSGNEAVDNGGAVFNIITSTPIFKNCLFDGNTAGLNGGGMHNISSSPDLYNCLFTNNTADEGAAIANMADACSPYIVNCTFSANDTGATGGIVRNMPNSTPVYTNCIFWGNASTTPNTVIADSPPGATVTYSIVEGGYPGIGNMNIDPMFVSATDLHLKPCSPALGRGDNSANGTMEEMDGNARIVGNIDLGVYELQSSTGTPITWTGNGDGENWSDAANWDTGAVPQKCNDVLIPAPHVVKVQASMEGLGRTLEVELGAELVTDPDGMTNIGN